MIKLLKVGGKGEDVRRVQTRLKELGFNPGRTDGAFGAATEAAVRAFQNRVELLADGIVGPSTLKALFENDLVTGRNPPHKNSAARLVTLERVAKMFPHAPIENIEKHLKTVLAALAETGLDDKPMVLMALATIRAETDGFEPISQRKSKYSTSPGGHPFDLYDNRPMLGNRGRPDGERFRGRGFVQLTGRYNYLNYGKAIGLGNGLIDNPELANEPKTAARLLAHFLKSKEPEIRQALARGDRRAARKLVNGGSHGLDRFDLAFTTGESLIV
ncbi:MAG: peptidoglycan-binding protein [Gammaproteobacteria bacterium]